MFRFSTVFKLDFLQKNSLHFTSKSGVWRGLKSTRYVGFVSKRVLIHKLTGGHFDEI